MQLYITWVILVLVQLQDLYSSIYIECEEKKINAKSIMGMMSLGLAAGEEVVVSANGSDEEAAVKHIEEYLSSNK